MKKILLWGGLVLLLTFFGFVSVAQAIRSVFTHAAVSVSNASSTSVLAANNKRNYLLLQNDHATQAIWCKFGATAVANDGFKLNAAGGTIIFETSVPVALLNCIAQTGATIILTTEGVQTP